MSFSFHATGTKAEIRQAVHAQADVRNGGVPLSLRIYLLDNLEAFADSDVIVAECYGHQKGVWANDSNGGNATVRINKIE